MHAKKNSHTGRRIALITILVLLALAVLLGGCALRDARRLLSSVDAVEESVLGMIDGKKVLAGNRRMMQEHQIHTEHLDHDAGRLAEEGKTALYIAEEQELLGIIAVADPVKETSAQAIRELERMGLSVVMLTGDQERTAAAIQKQLGITQFYWTDSYLEIDQSMQKLYNADGKEISGIALNDYFDDNGNYKGGLFKTNQLCT